MAAELRQPEVAKAKPRTLAGWEKSSPASCSSPWPLYWWLLSDVVILNGRALFVGQIQFLVSVSAFVSRHQGGRDTRNPFSSKRL